MLTAETIAGFCASVLQPGFDKPSPIPDFHMEWWRICCHHHPQIAIAAPRAHAKSTAITLTYVLAELLWRESKYALIVSDTTTQAAQFLADVKKELIGNDYITSLFKVQGFEKDTEDDVIVIMEDGHKFRIQAKGAEQKLRGLKWDHKRPDLIICDDLENDEIVMNPDRREKFKRWFYGALIPCKSLDGKIRVVGTILHEDSLLNNLMPRPWDKRLVETDLKVYTESPTPWMALKYRAHNQDFSKILWGSRYTKDWFQKRRQDYLDRGIPDVYSQEMLNEPMDETVAYFRKSDFIDMNQYDREITKESQHMPYYITADLAVSESERADYSVFVVARMSPDRILQVVNVIRERLDGKEATDMLLALQDTYKPELFGIEEMQVSKAIGPFLRERMQQTGKYINIRMLQHRNKDKIQRARSVQARIRAKGIKFDKESEWYPQFEEELCKFPRGRHDDQVDAFAYLGLMLDALVEAPTLEEIEEEEYQHDLQSSGNSDTGRSSWTGY